jgi:hypothetical protein
MATLVALQVLVCEKSDGTVPVIPMAALPKVNAAAPVFFTVTTCGLLVVFSATFGNARLAGVSVTVGNAPALPVPVMGTACGLPVALSVTVKLAVRPDPIAIGEKVIAILQLKPAARVAGQLLLTIA